MVGDSFVKIVGFDLGMIIFFFPFLLLFEHDNCTKAAIKFLILSGYDIFFGGHIAVTNFCSIVEGLLIISENMQISDTS